MRKWLLIIVIMLACSCAHALGTDYDKFVRRRATILAVSSFGFNLAGFGKGVADADTWGHGSNVVNVSNYWHTASVLQSVGAAMGVGALLYGVGKGDLTWWEAIRFGIGGAMKGNVIFKFTYKGLRYGTPVDWTPAHNRHLWYFPGKRDWSIGASQWYHVALYEGGFWFIGDRLKKNVSEGHGILWPIAGR